MTPHFLNVKMMIRTNTCVVINTVKWPVILIHIFVHISMGNVVTMFRQTKTMFVVNYLKVCVRHIYNLIFCVKMKQHVLMIFILLSINAPSPIRISILVLKPNIKALYIVSLVLQINVSITNRAKSIIVINWQNIHVNNMFKQIFFVYWIQIRTIHALLQHIKKLIVIIPTSIKALALIAVKIVFGITDAKIMTPI